MAPPRDQGQNNQPYYPTVISTHRSQQSQPDYEGRTGTGNDPISQLNDTSQPPPTQPPLSARRSATPFPVQAVLSDSQSSLTQSSSGSNDSGSVTLYDNVQAYVPPPEENFPGAYAPFPAKVVYPNVTARVPSDAQSSLHGYGGFAPTADSHHTGAHTLHSNFSGDLETGETTLVHHNPPPFPPPMPIPTMPQEPSSPPYANPRPSADYSKMPQPSRFSRLTHISLPRVETLSITSLTSRVDRLSQFFKDVYELPWVAPRITVDYVPGAGKSKMEGWYQDGRGSPEGRLDLIASPPAMSQQTAGSEPRSGTSSSGSPPQRRRSNYIAPGEFDPYEDYLRSIPQPGNIRYPNGYAPSYAYQTRPQVQTIFTPQQLYIYPGQQREMQQTRPIYFMAASPPSNQPILPPSGVYYPTFR